MGRSAPPKKTTKGSAPRTTKSVQTPARPAAGAKAKAAAPARPNAKPAGKTVASKPAKPAAARSARGVAVASAKTVAKPAPGRLAAVRPATQAPAAPAAKLVAKSAPAKSIPVKMSAEKPARALADKPVGSTDAKVGTNGTYVPPVTNGSTAAAHGGVNGKKKAGLNAKDLAHFRSLLLEKRHEILGDMDSMEREALRVDGSSLSTLPFHMADMGTDNYEQEFTLGLVEKERILLREIHAALTKMQTGTYGICEGTGNPIGKARLEVQPWARYSIEFARMREKSTMGIR